MPKTIFAILLLATSAFSQPTQVHRTFAATKATATVSYEQIAAGVGCDPQANWATQVSLGCLWPSIKVTAHPANPNAVGFFILTIYKSLTTGLMVTQSGFTMQRDASGDFIATFSSGDMSEITISAIEVEPGELVTASAGTETRK